MIIKVNSTNLSMVDYDQDKLTMTVYFKNGSIYEYFPIYETQILDFDKSESKGKWFNENIKSNKSLGVKKNK